MQAPTAPGVSQLLPLPYGLMARARRNASAFLHEHYLHFGDVFRYRVGPFLFHLISHPDGVRHVLQDNYRNYPRSWLYRFTKLVIGDGLVSTEGDVWRRQRRMIQPAFHHGRVAALAPVFTDAADAMLRTWQRHADSGRPFDVAAEMIGLTLRIVGKALLGVDLGGGETDAMSPAVAEALAYLDHRINRLVGAPLWVPTPANLRFRAAMKTLDRVVYDVIARRRRENTDAPDLLAMLLSVRDEETGGAGLTDREIRDQVMTFIGAGHETTAVALSWTFYLLSQHPGVDARLRAEVAEVLPGGRTPTVEDLPRLRVARRVVEESMRLYPPVFGVVRDVIDEDRIGGYRIPAGSSVVLSQYVTHRHAAVWDDPERFDPDRFTPERSAARPKFAYFPFLGGPHHCVGAEFALTEATLVVAMVAQRYRLRLATPGPVEVSPMLSLRPKGGLPMVVERAG